MNLEIELRHPDAKVPTRESSGAAGYDLYSVEEVCILPKDRAIVSIGLAMRIPLDCFGHILPRSSLAAKHGIQVMAGVIDSDYRGVVKVVLYNSSPLQYLCKKGDRIAQLVLQQIATPPIKVKRLDATERGAGGFGSTGI